MAYTTRLIIYKNMYLNSGYNFFTIHNVQAV